MYGYRVEDVNIYVTHEGPYEARSASSHSDDWPCWMVTAKGTNRNVARFVLMHRVGPDCGHMDAVVPAMFASRRFVKKVVDKLNEACTGAITTLD